MPEPFAPLPLRLAGGLRLLRLEHRLEVDFRQQHRREAGTGADVGDDRAQVRVDDARAGDADDRLQLVFGDVADLEDAALLGLDQEQRLVVDLGRDGRGDGDFVDAVGDRRGAQAEVDLDLRLALLEQDLRRVGLLERQILQVDALDLEHRGLVVVGHGGLGLEGWARARAARANAAAIIAARAGESSRQASCRAVRRRPSSGSRPPRWSSATRSSQPPTWVSPMKICGTVRRPVSSHHRHALRRVEVDADLVDRRRRRAAAARPSRAWQYGQTAVVYILTGCIVGAPVRRTSRPAGWRRARPPRPPASARAFSKPSFFSVADRARRRARRSGRPRPAAAPCSSAASGEFSSLAQRHALRAGRVAGGVLGRLADVDQHRLLAVDEVHRVGRRSPWRRRRALLADHRPQQQAAGRRPPRGTRIPVVDEELHRRRRWGRRQVARL